MGAFTMQYKANHYRQVEAQTNDPLKLIIMLFEGAINFLEKAKVKMIEGNVKEKGILITKAIAIIGELQGSLKMDQGGDFAFNMDRLYTYMSDRLYEANSKNSPEMLEEVLGHLRTYKIAWDKAFATQNSQPAAPQQTAPVAQQQANPFASAQAASAMAPKPQTRQQNDDQRSSGIEFVG